MPPPPSRPQLFPPLFAENLGAYFSLKSLDSGVPIRLSWTEFYLELLQWVRGVLFFRRKKEAKRFPRSSFPLPQTRPPYPRWRVVETSTLIWSRVPPRRNSPGNISPLFFWSVKCSSPMSIYALSANRIWNSHNWCNLRDNAYMYTP